MRGADDRSDSGSGLVPPRPNPGPEPWPEPGGWAPTILPWALAVAGALLLARWLRNRRRPRISPTGQPGLPEEAPPGDPSPRSRLIASSVALREALVAAFGPAWASKTTEEVAGDPALGDRLGGDRAARLAEFLRVADRAKFAGDGPEPAEDWAEWGESLALELTADPAPPASAAAGGRGASRGGGPRRRRSG